MVGYLNTFPDLLVHVVLSWNQIHAVLVVFSILLPLFVWFIMSNHDLRFPICVEVVLPFVFPPGRFARISFHLVHVSQGPNIGSPNLVSDIVTFPRHT